MGIALLFQKIIDKCRYNHRRRVFGQKTKNNVKTLRILGHLTLINSHIKNGTNVTIYPNVTFFGDGLIEIGIMLSLVMELFCMQPKGMVELR